MSKTEKTKHFLPKSLQNMLLYIHNNISAVNNSKFFAGLIIIVLNISSKFVEMKLSKSMEAYLKYTFSRDILVFAIAWMGTREIYVAAIVTVIFKLCFDYIFNENSAFCCLPSHFTEYHMNLLENNNKVTELDVKKAKEVLEKAEKQKQQNIASGEFVLNTPPSSIANKNSSIVY